MDIHDNTDLLDLCVAQALNEKNPPSSFIDFLVKENIVKRNETTNFTYLTRAKHTPPNDSNKSYIKAPIVAKYHYTQQTYNNLGDWANSIISKNDTVKEERHERLIEILSEISNKLRSKLNQEINKESLKSEIAKQLKNYESNINVKIKFGSLEKSPVTYINPNETLITNFIPEIKPQGINHF
ncbi:hypothetical protein [Grimontia sedimenti]|nr:hypothetical protein [Grimontia sedimenti]